MAVKALPIDTQTWHARLDIAKALRDKDSEIAVLRQAVAVRNTELAAARAQETRLRELVETLYGRLVRAARFIQAREAVLAERAAIERQRQAVGLVTRDGTRRCSVAWCANPANSGGLCRGHYQRKKCYGDPLLRRINCHRGYAGRLAREVGPGEFIPVEVAE